MLLQYLTKMSQHHLHILVSPIIHRPLQPARLCPWTSWWLPPSPTKLCC